MRLSPLTALGLGAATMFFLDPVAGARRRAIVRDKSIKAVRDAQRFLRRARRDAVNRASGALAEFERAVEPTFAGDDDSLVQRVRTAVGRAVSHPGAVHVMIENGQVRLDGAVLVSEQQALLSRIHSVEGVAGVDNHLAVREAADHVPGLQGTGAVRRSAGFGMSPASQLAFGTFASAVAVSYIVRRRRSARACSVRA